MAFSFRRGKKRDDVIVDRVTGAFNRRQLDAVIAGGFDTSDQPTATLLIDIDDFAQFIGLKDQSKKDGKKDGKRDGKKEVSSSDQVLERVSWVIMATVRTTDVVYRHSASSFCALLPTTSDEAAIAVADRIRLNVEKMPLLAEMRVTVSIGVATGTSDDLATTIKRADEALTRGIVTGANSVFRGGDVRVDATAVEAAADASALATPTLSEPVSSESGSDTDQLAPPALSPRASEELAVAFAAPTASSAPSMASASIPLTPPSL